MKEEEEKEEEEEEEEVIGDGEEKHWAGLWLIGYLIDVRGWGEGGGKILRRGEGGRKGER